MGKYKRLLENTGLITIGSFGSKMVSFVMLPFYTMWLSVEDYGTSDIITVYSTILLSIISLCIGEAIFVIPSQKEKEQQISYFTSSMVFCAACTIFLVFLYLSVSRLFPISTNSFCSNIAYICTLTFTTLITTIFQQFCKSINKITIFALTGVIQTSLVAGLGFLLIPRYHLDGYLWCMIIANIVSAIYILFSAKLYSFFRISYFSMNSLCEMLRYSVPLIPNSIIWLIVSYLNRPLMEDYLGLYAIGIYSLANKFPSLINTVYNNFSNSWQISVLEQYGKEGFESFYNKVSLIVFSFLTVIVAMFSLVTEFLITHFLNENYFDAIKYIPILCLSCVFIALGSIMGAVFSAIKQSKYFFYSSIYSAGSAIVLNYLLIKSYGLDGACWACVVSYLIGGMSRYWYASKFVTLKIGFKLTIEAFLLVLIIGAIVYAHSYVFAVALFSFLLLYILYLCHKSNVIDLLKLKFSKK